MSPHHCFLQELQKPWVDVLSVVEVLHGCVLFDRGTAMSKANNASDYGKLPKPYGVHVKLFRSDWLVCVGVNIKKLNPPSLHAGLHSCVPATF